MPCADGMFQFCPLFPTIDLLFDFALTVWPLSFSDCLKGVVFYTRTMTKTTTQRIRLSSNSWVLIERRGIIGIQKSNLYKKIIWNQQSLFLREARRVVTPFHSAGENRAYCQEKLTILSWISRSIWFLNYWFSVWIN